MKRVFIAFALLAGFALSSSAPAQFNGCKQGFCTQGSGVQTPFSLAWVSPYSSITTAGTSFSYASQNIGTADPTRIITVGISCAGTSGITFSGVTVGGNAASHVSGALESETSGTYTDFWTYADGGALGTSATIVITTSASMSRCAIAVYRVVGTGASVSAGAGNSATSGATSLSATISIPSGGGVASVLTMHTTNASGIAGSNLTLDGTATVYSTTIIQAGHNTTSSGSTSAGFTWSTATDATMSVVAFNP
jgi:hypothetical protein